MEKLVYGMIALVCIVIASVVLTQKSDENKLRIEQARADAIFQQRALEAERANRETAQVDSQSAETALMWAGSVLMIVMAAVLGSIFVFLGFVLGLKLLKAIDRPRQIQSAQYPRITQNPGVIITMPSHFIRRREDVQAERGNR
jgi:hypothetical protein